MKIYAAVVCGLIIFLPHTGGKQACGAELSHSVAIDEGEVIRIFLDNSPDMRMAQYDLAIRRDTLYDYTSIYDTFFRGSANFGRDTTGQEFSLMGSRSTLSVYAFDISKYLATGTRISLQASHSALDTDSIFYRPGIHHEGKAGISITQSLGRNRFGISDRMRIAIRKKDIANAEHTAYDAIEQAFARAMTAYWMLVFRSEEMKLKQNMLEDAKRLLAIYKDRLPLGTAERGDILGAEANVRVRENDVELARLERQTAINDLLFLLNIGRNHVDIVTLDSLSVTPQDIDAQKAIGEAVRNRRDYRSIKNLIEAQDMAIIISKNESWPQIDISASFRKNGLDDSTKGAWDSFFGESRSAFDAGVTVNVPIDNTLARAYRSSAKSRQEQLLIALKMTEMNIVREVYNTAEEANTFGKQIELCEKIVQLQEGKLKEEMKKVRAGRSGSDTVIRYEEDLLRAHMALRYAFLQYRISRIRLESAKQTLLDSVWEGAL